MKKYLILFMSVLILFGCKSDAEKREDILKQLSELSDSPKNMKKRRELIAELIKLPAPEMTEEGKALEENNALIEEYNAMFERGEEVHESFEEFCAREKGVKLEPSNNSQIDIQKIQKCIDEFTLELQKGETEYVKNEAIFYFETETDAIDTKEAAKAFAKANLVYIKRYVIDFKLSKEEALSVSEALYEVLRKEDKASNLDVSDIETRSDVYTAAQAIVVSSIDNIQFTETRQDQ
jgi:hypothetical protein